LNIKNQLQIAKTNNSKIQNPKIMKKYYIEIYLKLQISLLNQKTQKIQAYQSKKHFCQIKIEKKY
jgi:hypothetical protein